MTDIWDEKPIPDKFDQVFLKGEDAYWAKEMDAWLEKLKAEHDRLSSEYKAMAERALDTRQENAKLKDKLESVREAASRYNPPKGGFNIFGEILEILDDPGSD